MDQLERLQTLIGVADAVLQRQEQGDENVDGAALALALLIGCELQQQKGGENERKQGEVRGTV